MRASRCAIRVMIAGTAVAAALPLLAGCAPKADGTVTGALTFTAGADPSAEAAKANGKPAADQPVVIYLNGEVIAEGSTGPDGIYTLQAAPGEYTVDSDGCSPQDGPEVVVESSKTTSKNMICSIPE